MSELTSKCRSKKAIVACASLQFQRQVRPRGIHLGIIDELMVLRLTKAGVQPKEEPWGPVRRSVNSVCVWGRAAERETSL